MNHPSRLAAIEANEITFILNVPCGHGHLAPRYTRPGSRLAPRVECDRQSRSLRAKLAARKKYSRKRSAERQAQTLAKIAAREAAREAQQAAQREWWRLHHSAPKPKSTKRKFGQPRPPGPR